MAAASDPQPIPLATCGTPVKLAGAELVRNQLDEALTVRVWGAHVDGRWRSEQSFAVQDRAQLQSLITDLVLAQQALSRA